MKYEVKVIRCDRVRGPGDPLVESYTAKAFPSITFEYGSAWLSFETENGRVAYEWSVIRALGILPVEPESKPN